MEIWGEMGRDRDRNIKRGERTGKGREREG